MHSNIVNKKKRKRTISEIVYWWTDSGICPIYICTYICTYIHICILSNDTLLKNPKSNSIVHNLKSYSKVNF